MRTHYDNLHIKEIVLCLIKSTALALLAINAGTVTAAIIDRQASCGSSSGCYEISGAITASDATQARSLFANRFVPLVSLNSPGGDLYAAMEIGALLRSAQALAVVSPGASCESACVFLLAGATQRSVTGRVGIHRPYSLVTGSVSPATAQANYTKLQAASRQFFEEMNLPSALYEAMVRVPPEDMKYLSDSELAAFGLDAADPVGEEVSNSYYAGKYGLTKQEYLARKKAVYENCNPELQRTGDAGQYFLCEEQILTASFPERQARQQAKTSQLNQPTARLDTPTPVSSSPPQQTAPTQSTIDPHFAKIYSAHPDAPEIAATPQFMEWVRRDKERMRVYEDGATAEVITLLSEYKVYSKEGVRRQPANAGIQRPALITSESDSLPDCVFSQTMTDEDYKACGITPP